MKNLVTIKENGWYWPTNGEHTWNMVTVGSFDNDSVYIHNSNL